ncbi:siphovirus Gp157 family protein [Lactobacillus sp.]|uniref:siphovirus Gp157 family protein n=1 Tax=Lactobacillus sp. TaxID=1591 RepID=UPI0019BC5D2B|nr:siphovirus Gp157 family protein [Lactobacillus sp.]MBD5429686.1 hypothetical protein [Lactobacillus sp.]
MNNIFEINAAIKAVQEKDLDPEVIQDTLDSLALARDKKLDGVAGWIESNNAKIDWLSEKIKQLQDVKKHFNNQNIRLMDYLTAAIDNTGKKEIKTAHHLLKPRNYRDSVVVENSEELPADYIKLEEVQKIDKAKLYEDLKKGKEITGAHLKENRKTRIM